MLLKKAAGIEKASGEPNKKKVAKLPRAEAMKIAESKMQDLNAADIEAATRMTKVLHAAWASPSLTDYSRLFTWEELSVCTTRRKV